MHTVCHIEFHATDLARSQAFYEGLFGWTFRAFGPSMVVFGQGDAHIGGLIKVDEVAAGSSPSVWFDVESIDDTMSRGQALGGGVRLEKSEVPSVGWSAVLVDPDGNGVGLVQFAPRG